MEDNLPRYLVDFKLEYLPVEEADLLVVGGGLAGLFTAWKCRHAGRVVVLGKKGWKECNSYQAQGGIAAALGEGDSAALHREDTLRAGAGLCREEAVRVLVEEGPARVRELMALGVPFDREGERISLTREGAHSVRRILHAKGDATGEEIMAVLQRRLEGEQGITFRPGMFVIDLLVEEGRCLGALAWDTRASKPQAYLAPAVVLATGGAGQVYPRTTNPAVATGDGVAMAYRAGARLVDLEFVQFHPTTLYAPPAPAFLISESVRGEGAWLRNVRGERFMPRYHPLDELAPRDVVSRSIVREMEATGASWVYLDLAPIGVAAARQRFPKIWKACEAYGVDLSRGLIPVAPAAHYFMGGVQVDLWGRTSVEGLYACGEVACTGAHGANRLASNSLLECLVFGERIARVLAEKPPVRSKGGVRNPYSTLHYAIPRRAEKWDPAEARQRIGEAMGSGAWVIRSGAGLKDAARIIEESDPNSWQANSVEGFEAQNLALVARLVVEAALCREESRGGHFRSDFPGLAGEKGRHLIIERGRDPFWE